MGKRILFVIGSLDLGGAEKHVANLCLALKRRGWQPEVQVYAAGGPLTSLLTDNGIPVHATTLPQWLGRFVRNRRFRVRIILVLTSFALLARLWTRRPDIIHFFLPAAYLMGGVVSLLTPVKARIMSRRSLRCYQDGHPLLARLERWLHPKMSLILANSQAVADDLVAEGVKPEKIQLLYNGIDLSQFSQPKDRRVLRAALGLGEDNLVMIMVANLIPYKGHADLITSLSMIKDRLPKGWVLLNVGYDGGIGKQLQALVDQHGLAENIRFLGSRTDVPDLLGLSDIGLLVSHEEGFSNAILEGMAAGLPMVVTDVGGNKEAVLDGRTGYVVPARSPSELASALLRMTQSAERTEMGRRGRERVLELFSLEACVDAYERTYRDVTKTM